MEKVNQRRQDWACLNAHIVLWLKIVRPNRFTGMELVTHTEELSSTNPSTCRWHNIGGANMLPGRFAVLEDTILTNITNHNHKQYKQDQGDTKAADVGWKAPPLHKLKLQAFFSQLSDIKLIIICNVYLFLMNGIYWFIYWFWFLIDLLSLTSVIVEFI